MKASILDPRRIVIPSGRAPDPDTVEKLKSSMAEIGLLNPITVQSRYFGGPPHLVAGRNRLEAALSLGWDEVRAVILPDGTDDSGLADLAEIAENLHRRELGEVERAELMARWVEIAARRPVPEKLISAQVGQKSNPDRNPRGAGRKPSGISQAARDLGVTRQSVERSIKIASLSPEAKAAGRDAPQAALLAAAKETEPAAQVAAIEAHIAKGRLAVPEPEPEPVGPVAAVRAQDDDIHLLDALKAAWEAAPEKYRDAFAAWAGWRHDAPDLDALQAAWDRAGPKTRSRFLEGIGARIAC
jgi:hypothetical protein